LAHPAKLLQTLGMRSDTTTTDLDWEAIEAILPADWKSLASEMKLVRPNLPEHMGTKVKDIGAILRLVLYQVARNAALASATAAFSAAQILTLSSVALHKWQKKIGGYLSRLVSAMVAESHAGFAPECWAGFEVCAVDASCVQRPGSKGTTARVHRAIRLADLSVKEVHVTDDKGGETLRRFDPGPGELWIGDRGYANPPGIAWADGRGAKVLIRYNRGSLPLYDEAGQVFDVQHKLRHMGIAGRCRQWTVYVHPHKACRIQARLCAVRLPADKAQEARERLCKEEGSHVSEQSLQMAEFVVVVTTVPDSSMSCDMILDLYRARWQVELDFKRDKSITGLDKLPNFRHDTILSWIYAKLLLQQIVRRLSTPLASIPPCAIERALCSTTKATTAQPRHTTAPATRKLSVAGHGNALESAARRIAPRLTARRPCLSRTLRCPPAAPQRESATSTSRTP
jgi:hypothetical protein